MLRLLSRHPGLLLQAMSPPENRSIQPSGAIQNHKGLAPTLHKLRLQAAIEGHQTAAMVHQIRFQQAEPMSP